MPQKLINLVSVMFLEPLLPKEKFGTYFLNKEFSFPSSKPHWSKQEKENPVKFNLKKFLKNLKEDFKKSREQLFVKNVDKKDITKQLVI